VKGQAVVGIDHAPIQSPAQPASILTATCSQHRYRTHTLNYNPSDEKPEAPAKQAGQKPTPAQVAGKMIGAQRGTEGRLGDPLAEWSGLMPGRPDI
jgi:hypothetical protein